MPTRANLRKDAEAAPLTGEPLQGYAMTSFALLLVWGLFDAQLWYFLGWGCFAFFVLLRRKSRFQVPWFLEIFPAIFLISYVCTIYYFRNLLLTRDAKGDALILDSLWITGAGNFLFSLACLGTIQMLTPARQTIRLDTPLQAIPARTLQWIYGAGLILNLLVVPFSPLSFRALFFSIGNIEVVALGMMLFLGMHQAQGYGRFETRLALFGLAFWAARNMATSLFGGTIATMICLAMLFARKVAGWLAISGILFVLIFAPLVQGVKKQVRGDGDLYANAPQESVQSAFKRNFEAIIVNRDLYAYKQGFDAFMERVDTMLMFMKIKNNIDTRQNFARGETLMASVFWSFVPRFLYPDKPITGGSSQLAKEYADMHVPEGTSVGVGPIPEFYINYGVPGVWVGMSLLGLFYGFLMQRMFSHPRQPLGFVLGALTFSTVIRPETNLGDSLGATLRWIFVWVVLLWITREKPRRARGASPLPPRS